jgi:hypothetical protein
MNRQFVVSFISARHTNWVDEPDLERHKNATRSHQRSTRRLGPMGPYGSSPFPHCWGKKKVNTSKGKGEERGEGRRGSFLTGERSLCCYTMMKTLCKIAYTVVWLFGGGVTGITPLVGAVRPCLPSAASGWRQASHVRSKPYVCLPPVTRRRGLYYSRKSYSLSALRPCLTSQTRHSLVFEATTLSPFSILAVTRGFVFLPTNKVQFMSESSFIHPKLATLRSRRLSSPAFP